MFTDVRENPRCRGEEATLFNSCLLLEIKDDGDGSAGSIGDETLRMVDYIVKVYKNYKEGQPVNTSEVHLSDLDNIA